MKNTAYKVALLIEVTTTSNAQLYYHSCQRRLTIYEEEALRYDLNHHILPRYTRKKPYATTSTITSYLDIRGRSPTLRPQPSHPTSIYEEEALCYSLNHHILPRYTRKKPYATTSTITSYHDIRGRSPTLRPQPSHPTSIRQ